MNPSSTEQEALPRQLAARRRPVPSDPEDADRLRQRSGVRRAFPAIAALALLAAVPGFSLEPQMDDSFASLRQQMVEDQILRRGVEDRTVIAAMETVPRHLFVPESQQREAYIDSPLPIGQGQTISQPYIVALMTELLDLDGSERVLEGKQASRLLAELGYSNVHVRIDNGYHGWPEEAPFDAIIVTASPPSVPQALVDQLDVGGRMVIPVGAGAVQSLELLVKSGDGKLKRKTVVPVRFVPMIGEQD